MSFIELVNRNLSCVIAPHLGGAVMRLDVIKRGTVINVLQPTPEGTTDPRLFALTHLAPIGGAVRGNAFKWDGKPKTVEPNLPDAKFYTNGIAWQRPWTGKKDGKYSATLKYFHKQAPGWPFDFSVTAVFDLEEDNLTITYELASEVKQGAHPIGFGSSLRLPKSKNILLSAGVSSIWTVDADNVPVTLAEVPYELDIKEGLQLNSVDTPERWYNGWTGKASIDYAESKLSLMLKSGDPLSWLGMSCRKADDFLRLTTLTHVPGVLDIKGHDEEETGWRVLGPGESIEGQLTIDVDLNMY